MLYRVLEERLQAAVKKVCPDAISAKILVRPCPDPKFGDYQSNALMSVAKERRMNPRQLATDVVKELSVADICEKVDIAGAGFLNFHLKTSAVAEWLTTARDGKHLFFAKSASPKTAIIDFSSPNVAKPMHVGHIRSTILGESLVRVFRALGHNVITDNHLGDWGTQFGKLIVGWKTRLDKAALAAEAIVELERLYKNVDAECKANPEVLEQARQELVKLQNGDPENLAIWNEMIAVSRVEFDKTYERLGAHFDHTLGESFYNPELKSVVDDLRAQGIAQESEGATVVFFTEPELKDHPALVQKSDGAANYTTTDLATLQYRFKTWSPQQIIYVTDGRQQLHFKQFFAIFRRWKPEWRADLVHVWFGAILGDDGKPFKTRSGETIRLSDLLDEAEERAFALVTNKNPELPESERREVARVVGLGAIKYADLSQNRQSDYIFNWDKMLAFHGNTAPYLQYAYTRIQSILRKSEEAIGSKLAIRLTQPEEVALAKHLLLFGLSLEGVAEDYRPNFLCSYLYDLAGQYTKFYENCPVLKASDEERPTRLALCELTGKVLKQGLALLGIETAERM